MKHHVLRIIFVASSLLAAGALAAYGSPSKHGLSIRETPHGVSVEFGGQPFAEYVIDQANKPYLWPVIGPTGKSMTRGYPMVDLPGEPAAQRDHPHQRGISFGLEDCNGNTWCEPATYAEMLTNEKTTAKAQELIAKLGSIKHREFTRLDVRNEGDDSHAVVESICEYRDPAGKVGLTERRRFTFRATDTTRMIDVDQDLRAGDKPVRVGDNKDAGLYIRVPVDMAVDSKQGGRIVNSEGLVDAAAWSKPARWCDYHGPSGGETLGIAILNHPSSFRHPTRWHVRPYGLFTANPFAQRVFDNSLPDGSITLQPDAAVQLRHRFVFHSGDEQAAGIEKAWQAYAKETPAVLTTRP
jgi:hypothetical protein